MYEFSLPLGSYVYTCTNFYVFSGPRWLASWIGCWTPIKLPHHRSCFPSLDAPAPAPLVSTHCRLAVHDAVWCNLPSVVGAALENFPTRKQKKFWFQVGKKDPVPVPRPARHPWRLSWSLIFSSQRSITRSRTFQIGSKRPMPRYPPPPFGLGLTPSLLSSFAGGW